MGLFKFWDEKIKKMNVWDIGILKTYCLLIGVVIGAFVTDFVREYLTAFITVIIILMAILLARIFKK